MNEELTQSTETEQQAVPRFAFKVMVGSLFSLLAGLASQMVIAALFGAGAELDAFLTALVVPIYLQAVLLSGLTFVLIPAFVQEETEGRKGDAWALTGTFFWLTAGILTIITILAVVFSETTIGIIAPGLDRLKAELATSMLVVIMLSLPFSGIGTLTAGVQNAQNKFFWPAIAAALGSIGNVLILLLLFGRIGAVALAWGFLASEIIRSCVTIIPTLRHGWRSTLPIHDFRVRNVVRLLLPFIIFGFLTRAILIFERYFASWLPDGELSYLGYGSKITKIFLALLGGSIATAIFPAMARSYSFQGKSALVEKLEFGLRLSLVVGLPVVMIMGALGEPLVTVLFERGEFDQITTQQVNRIVPIVLVGGVLLVMIHNIIRRAFYVTKDTRTPPIIDSFAAIFFFLIAGIFVRNWGYVGLAWVTPIYSGLDILVLFVILSRRLNSFPSKDFLRKSSLYLVASLLAFFAAWYSSKALSSISALPQLIFCSIFAGTIYMLIIFRFDHEIALAVLEMTGAQRIFSRAKGFFQPTTEDVA